MSFSSPESFNNLVPVNNQDSRIIVFVDSAIVGCEHIIQRVIPKARVIVIGSKDDGVNEISKILHGSNCLEVHIFSSGFPGCIYLGKSELSLNTLTTYSLELGAWFKTNNFANLVNSPELWIYSLNLDVGDVGEEFLTKLNRITKAKINVLTSLLASNILTH